MFHDPAATVHAIIQMHHATVARWHQRDLDNPYEGLVGLACAQHQFNFLLWHEEDVARSPNAGDARIAQVKRAIDGYNQQRNDGIEKLDDFLMRELAAVGVVARAGAPLNTETPASAIDRLSIMALRIYHLREQLERTDAGEEHHDKVRTRLDLCQAQHRDLTDSLIELLADIRAGRKRLKLYRQMKMYNDPTLNPYLYAAARKAG